MIKARHKNVVTELSSPILEETHLDFKTKIQYQEEIHYLSERKT